MKTVRCLVACSLVVGLAACSPLIARPVAVGSRITLPGTDAPSVLVSLMDGTPQAGAELRTVLRATARGGERVIVLDRRGGGLLASSVAPASPVTSVPRAPARVPANATTYQEAQYRKAASGYRSSLRRARRALRLARRRELTAWAAAVAARAESALAGQREDRGGLSSALNTAAADLSSLAQAGLNVGDRKVIAILGGAVPVPGPGQPLTGLQGSTVVVAGSGGSGSGQAALRASLLAASASRVVVLTQATGAELAAAVSQGLSGAMADSVLSILFGAGSARLSPAALAQLRRIGRLMTTDGSATATIIGYTDDLPAPGGNPALSRRRADAVGAWLTGHGVSSARLQVLGVGATDPAAANTRGGQPLDRRVVVVIDPAPGA
jgi:outer membrane protein OmpA-like peptidoglycan-associated protein